MEITIKFNSLQEMDEFRGNVVKEEKKEVPKVAPKVEEKKEVLKEEPVKEVVITKKAKSKKEATKEKKEEKAVNILDDSPEITKDELRAKLVESIQSLGEDYVIKLVRKVGSETLSGVPKDKYAELMALLSESTVEVKEEDIIDG